MNKLLGFPHDYVIIDLEMTGLDPEKDSIIEIAGIRVIEDNIRETFSSLIQPDGCSATEKAAIKEEISALTGITGKMLSHAPYFSQIAPELSGLIGSLPIIGHNIPLDIRFLNKAMEEHGYPAFQNQFADTLALSQKLFPELIHHRLKDMALYYGVDVSDAHRALKDCHMTKSCFDRMRETMRRSFPSEEAFAESFANTGRRLKAEQALPFPQSFDTRLLPHPLAGEPAFGRPKAGCGQNPVSGKSFAFTGVLTQMSRREAMVWVANLGGKNVDKLTGDVDYLVSGWKEQEILTAGGLSGKEAKALRRQAEGFPISILTEDEFYRLLSEASAY